ncbi:MBL fold metallo-hydrolase, partial [Streptomyces beijiangensis]|nr:MBL fold metallo-hydrolase [Streptomyces beijiangensis]
AEGLQAHLDLQGGQPHGVMLPIHWGTFNLAPHAWSDPGEGTLAAGARTGSRIALPHPGQPFEPASDAVPDAPWWRSV